MTETKIVPSSPTKLPSLMISSDDFEVVRGGKRYWTHAGEHIVLSGQSSIEDVVISMGLATVRNVSDLSAEEAREAKATLETMIGRSAAAIESWTWTDNDGNRYPSPPDQTVLRRLSPEELAYINEKVIGGGDTKDAAKNGSSPSTSRSMRRRAPRRRQNG